MSKFLNFPKDETNTKNGECTARDFNTLGYELENAISSGGIDTNTTENDQLSKSIANRVALGSFYNDVTTDYGHINLTIMSPFKKPTQYYNGMIIAFLPTGNNEENATINVSGLGEKAIRKDIKEPGIPAGTIKQNEYVQLIYNGPLNCFVIFSNTQYIIDSQTYEPFLIAYTQNSRRQLLIKYNTILELEVDGTIRNLKQTTDEIIDVESILDTGSSLTNGKDYYLYLVADGDYATKFVVSLNSTFPNGFTANNSRKIGGFHTECADVGTIADHPLSGYLAGDILPNSVWCLNHRPFSNPEGMVYEPITDEWVDIYNLSVNGTSEYGATRWSNIQYYDILNMLRTKNKMIINDSLFYFASKYSNQKTSVSGDAQPNPDITGGHSDTASRRMVSGIGCEEMCGLQWQFLDAISSAGGSGWNSQNGNEGLFYGNVMVLFAGGNWSDSSACGSRARYGGPLSSVSAPYGGRGQSKSKKA